MTHSDAAHERDLDAATLLEYRAAIEEGAAQLDAVGKRVAGATAALFSALARRDQERLELLVIVRGLASLTPDVIRHASPEILALIAHARRVVGEREPSPGETGSQARTFLVELSPDDPAATHGAGGGQEEQ
jgi:hypothetical protein